MTDMSKMDYKLIVFDPEEEKHYEVILDHEDYLRAQKDEVYLNALLQHAKNNVNEDMNEDINNTETSVSEFEDSSVNFNPCTSAKKAIKIWAYDECQALIKSMTVHYKDLNNLKKKKFVYDNIANDLISAGFNVNVVEVQNKWKSLVRSYQKCKDTRTRTGQAPSRFLFYEVMDEVLGVKPTNECPHSLNSTFFVSDQSCASSSTEVTSLESQDHSTENSNLSNETSSSGESAITRFGMKRKAAAALRSEYMKRKMEEYEARKSRHQERISLEEKKIDIEYQKLKMLSEFLGQRNLKH